MSDADTPFDLRSLEPGLAAELAQLTQLGLWEADLRTGQMQWSEQLYRIHGLVPHSEPMTVTRIREFVHPDDLPSLEAAVAEALGPGGVYRNQRRIRLPDGRERVVLGHGLVLRDKAGEPERLVGTCQDITEQVVAEREAREAAARLAESRQDLTDAQRMAKLGSWSWDVVSDTLLWSDELFRIYGLDPEGAPVTFADYLEHLHPDDRERVQAETASAMASCGSFSSLRRLIRPDGEVRWVRGTGNVECDEDGRPLRLFGTCLDLTETTLVEAALERSNALLRSQQESSPDGILTVDENRRIIGYNSRFAEMWRVPPALVAAADEIALIDHVLDSVAEPERWLAQIEALYADPTLSARDEIVMKDGRVFERFSYPATSPEGDFFGRVWNFRDITERRRLAEALQAQNEQLKVLDRLKIDFVSSVSHELRTPITSILGYTDFLEEVLELPPETEAATFVEEVRKGARRLQRLVDDLMDFALIEAGAFKLARDRVDVGARVRELAVSLRPQIEAAEQTLSLDLPGAPLWAELDAERIGQVLLNLIGNAIKFTPPGGQIAVEASASDGWLDLRIRDSGTGIDADILPRLFQRYARGGGGGLPRGSGLGLHISKALVEAHGGAIGVESVVGAGSTFWFRLPVDPPTETGSGERQSER